MRYGKVFSQVWRDKGFEKLSTKSKILYFYFLSCENGNCIGLYSLGLGQIEDDTGLEKSDIEMGLNELSLAGMIKYKDRIMFIPKFFKWNTFINPNTAKEGGMTFAAMLEKDIPNDFAREFVLNVNKYLKKFHEAFFSKISNVEQILNNTKSNNEETLPECMPNVSETLPECMPNVSETLPECMPNKREVRSKKKEVRNIDISSLRSDISCATPFSKIQENFNSICVSMPKCTVLSQKRKAAIKTCWTQYGEKIYEAFTKAEDSDFLSGRNGKWTMCNFDWLMNSNNLLKVIEGNYDERTPSPQADGNRFESSSGDWSKYIKEQS